MIELTPFYGIHIPLYIANENHQEWTYCFNTSNTAIIAPKYTSASTTRF